jgi:protein-tyrosine phosphatase
MRPALNAEERLGSAQSSPASPPRSKLFSKANVPSPQQHRDESGPPSSDADGRRRKLSMEGGRLTPSAAASLVPAPPPEALQPRRLVSPPSRILPDLFLGDHGASTQYKLLVEAGVTHILNVRGGASVPPPPYGEQLSVHSVKISDFGDDDLRVHLAPCFAVIDAARSAGGRCLVHCSMGVNRSPSIVLCYLMCAPHTRWSLRDAWEYVRARRPIVSPHHLYWAQLEAIECETHGLDATTLSSREARIFLPPGVVDDERLRDAASRSQASHGAGDEVPVRGAGAAYDFEAMLAAELERQEVIQ